MNLKLHLNVPCKPRQLHVNSKHADQVNIFEGTHTVNESIDVQTTWDSKVNRLQKALRLCWLWCEAPIRLGCGDSPSSPCQLNKGVRWGGGGGGRLAEREEAEFRLPLTAQPVGCENVSLFEPRTLGEMGSGGGRIETGLLKIMFLESAWHSHFPQSSRAMQNVLLRCWISFSILPFSVCSEFFFSSKWLCGVL